MGIEIHAVGGYNEVGKNMTAIKVDDEVIICDMGIHLEAYIKYTEDEDLVSLDPDELMKVGAVPNIAVIDGWKKKVKAIIPTHAHLDHIGAIPFLAKNYDAPVLCTPFAAEVINATLKSEKIHIPNKIMALNQNSFYQISPNIKVEFINMTHSTPHTVMLAIHTKYGVIMYANDFKLDQHPIIGRRPDFEKLKQLGKKGVLALIVDSTYAYDAKKTPSESVAREMLNDVLLGTESKGKTIIVSTFSSHIARLKSIIEIGKKLNRKVVLLGRSLAKYVDAAEEVGLVNFSKDVEIVRYSKQVKRRLKKIGKGKNKYLFIATGHQGEPKSMLSKMIDGKMDFKFDQEDHVVFSCKVIPTETNQRNREELEQKLKDKGVRIFKDIHVSGHAAREDLRDLLNMVKPKHIIPAHGNKMMKEALAELALEMGNKKDNIHLINDGGKLKL